MIFGDNFQNSKPVNIALAADDCFAQHLGVTVASILANALNGSQIGFYIIDVGISDLNKNKLKSIIENFENIHSKIFFISAEDKFKTRNFKTNQSFSIATYARIFLGDLLPKDLTKIIYLDSDLVVESDLSELWNYSFGSAIILAVQDASLELPKIYRKQLKIPYEKGVFNAGVIVIDLERFRNENIAEKIIQFLESNKSKLYAFDQDGINSVLFNDWKQISPVWNQAPLVAIYKNYKLTPYSHDDFWQAKNHPRIIHYFSRFNKPWSFEGIHPLANRYYHYLKMTPWKGYRPKPTLVSIFSKAINFFIFRIAPFSLWNKIFTISLKFRGMN